LVSDIGRTAGMPRWPVAHVEATHRDLRAGDLDRHRLASGLDNVEFRRGHIEDLPVDDATVDMVISNCVISLSARKERVLAEALRVLVPGGRLAFADLATLTPLPAAIQSSLAAWVGCIAGALTVDACRDLLVATGFVDVDVRVIRTFGRADLDLTSQPEGSSTTRRPSVPPYPRSRQLWCARSVKASPRVGSWSS
jgi:SAM-dependent methyltransferase